MMKESLSRRVFNTCNVLFMVFMVVITFYPIYYVIMASFSNSYSLMKHTGLLLKPAGFSFNAYRAVTQNPNILNGYKNTLVILAGSLIVNMLLTCLGAYVLSRKNVLFNGIITMIIIFTMFFSGGMIPTYLLVKNLHLTNTYWALILPSAVSTYNMIIMRTGFAAIPYSLEESAKIDGASHWTILCRIVLPLSMPTVAVIILYYAVSCWNSWFSAMIYLQKRRDLQPLQLILRGILIENDTTMMGNGAADNAGIAETIKYAVIVVSTLPILVVYPFLQKYFTKGIMIGAVKG